MTRPEGAQWSRRELIRAATLLAVAAGTPVSARTVTRLSAKGAAVLPHRLLLREVSQMVLPNTATAGAGELGVGDFVALGLAHGLRGAGQPLKADADPRLLAHRRPDHSLDHASWLEADLEHRLGGRFITAPLAKRQAALSALDAETYQSGASDHPWRVIKALILVGYYTSETAAAKELRYDPSPGRYDPDLPLTPQTRAISNDWTAIDFG